MRTRTLLVAGGATLAATLSASVLVAGQVTASTDADPAVTVSGTTVSENTVAGNTVAKNTVAKKAAQKVTLTEKAVSIGQQDVGDKGPSIGDTFSFVSDLFNARGGKMGLAVGDGVLVPGAADGSARYHFVATYRLPGGDVAAGGIYDFDRPVNRVAIVGGTGRYVGAQGALAIVAKSEDTYTVTFRFDP